MQAAARGLIWPGLRAPYCGMISRTPGSLVAALRSIRLRQASLGKEDEM